MRVSRIITWGWAALEDRDWELRHTVLLTGEPGGGAQALLAALQVLLAAGSDAAAPASLADWSLGRLGDGVLLRSRATTYVAAVIEPDEPPAGPGAAGTAGPGATAMPFTVALGVEARQEQGRAQLQQPPQFFIVRAALTREHFLPDGPRGDASDLVPVNQWSLHLQAGVGLMPDAIQRYDTAAAYLQHLHGTLQGRAYVSEAEAMRAARALCRSLGYRDIGDVNELVRGEILDGQDAAEDIRRMRALMQALARQQAEVQRLELATRRLRDIGAAADEVLDVARHFVVDTIAHAQRALADTQGELRRTALAMEQQTQRSRQAEERLQALRDEQRNLEARLSPLRAHLSHSDVAREQKFLRDSLDLYEREFRIHWQALRGAARTAGTLLLRTTQLLEMDFSGTPLLQRLTEPLHATLRRLMLRWRGDLNASLLTEAGVADELPAFDLEDFDADLMALDRALRWDDPSVMSVVADALTELGLRREQLEQERQGLVRDLAQLRAGRPPAPQDVQEALALLAQEVPQSQPRLLAELVEPRPGTRWQQAIEGYMGRDRFSIVVEPGFEAECMRRVLERFPMQSPKVVEGSKALEDTQGMSLQATAVLRELQCSHPVARAYLIAEYGRLRKVKNEEGLARTAQGLMHEGLGSRGYGMFSCRQPEDELAFGSERRNRRRVVCDRRLAAIGHDLRELDRLAGSLKRVAALYSGLSVQVLAPLAAKVLDVQFQYLSARRTLEALDVSSIEGLDRQATELDSALAQSHRSYDAEMLEIGRQAEAMRRSREQADFHGERLPALEQGASQALRWAARFAAMAAVVASERQLLDEAQALAQRDDLAVPDLKARLDAAPARLAAALRHLRGSVNTYLAGADAEDERFLFADPPRSLDRLEDVLAAALRVRDDAARQLGRQEDVGLAGASARLAEAGARFQAVFVNGLCQKVRDEVRAGQAMLERLNRELRDLAFDGDTYRLEWDWVPEYQRFLQFFEAACDPAARPQADRVQMLDSPDLPEAQRATAARLRQLLLSPDVAAEQTLRDLADYRNYRRYDLVRHNDSGQMRLSSWGPAAAGELAAPLYTLRAAVLVLALGHRGPDRRHGPALRLMLLDDSFATLGEARARAVLQFLARRCGLQLVVALPAAASGPLKPEFAKEWSFSRVLGTRSGRMLDVMEAHEKDLDPQALGRLWAEHGRLVAARHAGLRDLPRRRQASVEDDA